MKIKKFYQVMMPKLFFWNISYLFFLLMSYIPLAAQTNLSVGNNENLTISSGGILSVNQVSFEPSSLISLTNTNITESLNTVNTSGISNIDKVLVLSNSLISFSGQITIGYDSGQLNGIAPADLKISFFDTVWNPIAASIVNAGARTVSANFSGININEITLEGVAITTTPTVSTPLSPSSGGGGGGSSSNPDRDGDGIPNNLDVFPDDPDEWLDTDGDGIGDNADLDDDNDGVSDEYEGYCFTDPKDPFDLPGDYDKDGLPNCIDLDDDQDGYSDEDEIKCDSNLLDELDLPLDTDGDFLANCVDPDDDNDTYLDEDDAFPLDKSEWLDTDLDGLGNNIDLDDDNDCYNDTTEIEADTDPLDSNSTPLDYDNDCIPDKFDLDYDNDGYPDDKLLISQFISINGDGINDYWKIVNIELFPNNTVSVYSRSGYLVFKEKNYKNDWYGSFKGKTITEGSYYYIIDSDDDGDADYQGWLYVTK